MLQAFIDESVSEDWFFMAAAIARSPTQVDSLESQFRALLRDESERLAIPCPNEVHGYDLFQGVDMWGDVKLHERLAVAGRVLAAVRDHDIRFIIRGIDVRAQRAKYTDAYDPYPLVLTHVVRELDKYARARRDTVRVHCDEFHHHDRHRAMLERHRRQGTPGYQSTNLESVVDNLNFLPSEDSAMVQAADIVAYLHHRAIRLPNPSRAEQRSRRQLGGLFSDQIDHSYCWVP